MNKLTDFGIGIIAGFIIAAFMFGVVAGVFHLRNKNREKIDYVEKQQAIEVLREDYGNRDPYEFLETIPDVRRAADGATEEFLRKRDEALERFRSGLAGRRNF